MRHLVLCLLVLTVFMAPASTWAKGSELTPDGISLLSDGDDPSTPVSTAAEATATGDAPRAAIAAQEEVPTVGTLATQFTGTLDRFLVWLGGWLGAH